MMRDPPVIGTIKIQVCTGLYGQRVNYLALADWRHCPLFLILNLPFQFSREPMILYDLVVWRSGLILPPVFNKNSTRINYK